tara:strand:+ start:139 stop:501 length:363 start_codon:yes stop_codon:yes gene_type:complete
MNYYIVTTKIRDGENEYYQQVVMEHLNNIYDRYIINQIYGEQVEYDTFLDCWKLSIYDYRLVEVCSWSKITQEEFMILSKYLSHFPIMCEDIKELRKLRNHNDDHIIQSDLEEAISNENK